MVPSTYHNKETFVRVCDSCSYLAKSFIDALSSGDEVKAMTFYDSGNVNLHCPISICKSAPHPIHCVVQGR